MTEAKFETLVENLAGGRRVLEDAIRDRSDSAVDETAIDPDTFAGYLAGTLPEAERQEIAARLSSSPDLRDQVLRAADQLQAVRTAQTPADLLQRVSVTAATVPEAGATQTLWQRIGAFVPAPRLAAAAVTAGLAGILYVAFEPPGHVPGELAQPPANVSSDLANNEPQVVVEVFPDTSPDGGSPISTFMPDVSVTSTGVGTLDQPAIDRASPPMRLKVTSTEGTGEHDGEAPETRVIGTYEVKPDGTLVLVDPQSPQPPAAASSGFTDAFEALIAGRRVGIEVTHELSLALREHAKTPGPNTRRVLANALEQAASGFNTDSLRAFEVTDALVSALEDGPKSVYARLLDKGILQFAHE